MASVRLNPQSLQEFEGVLSAYVKTNPSTTGEDRLLKVIQMFAEFNGAMRIAENDEEKMTLEKDYLKQITAFAYAEYQSTWTKSSFGLSARLLTFVGQLLGMRRKVEKTVPIAPYAGPSNHFINVPETDEAFFGRIHAALHPKPATVVKELMPIGYGSTAATVWEEKARKTAANQQQNMASSSPEVVFPRPGFPLLGKKY